MRLDIKKVLRRVREEIGYPEGAYLFLDELRENLKRKVTAKELAVEFFKTKLNLMDNPNFNEMEKKEIHIYRRYATILLIHLIEEEGEEEFADKLHDIFFREFEFTFMTNLGMERMDGTIEANISADWIANMIVREQRKKGLYADNPMIDADINEEIEQKKEKSEKKSTNT